MKTKDFIKMLQEADPTGEAYVRLPDGGAPHFAAVVPGYWDGAYCYVEDGDSSDYKIVTSTEGDKVDIYTTGISNIIWEENGDYDRVIKRVKYDLTYVHNDERIKEYQDYIKKECEYAKNSHEKSIKEWTERVIDKWFNEEDLITTEIRQPLDNKIGYYNCITAHHLFKPKEKLCQGECMALIESGKFYPVKKKKYYVWKYDPEKGKKWIIE